MSKEAGQDSIDKQYEDAVEQRDEGKYTLRLFVAGMTSKSQRAIEAVRKLCETELKGRYELEVVDIYQRPELIKEEQVLAAPTLIKKLPLPLRRIIGDMSNTDRVLVALDLRPRHEE